MTARSVDFDAIVIGAGHNGLTCAAYLARHGLRTLLLEARATVGGTAASDEFDGATVNICNCDHLTFRTTPIADELDLTSHGLSYIDMVPSQLNGDWESRRFWPLHHDVDETVESLASVHPRAADSYRRYAADAVPVARLITEAANNPPTRGSLLGHVLRRGGRGVSKLLRFSRMSAVDVMTTYFDDEAVYGPALATGPVVWGLSPDTPGTGLGALTYAMKHVAHVGRPVGGSGALPDALLSCFLSAGGMVRCNTAVVSINCDASSVNSVTTAAGDTITADCVVSATDPGRTFVQWLRNAPAAADGLVRKWERHETQHGYESKMDAVLTTEPSLVGYDGVTSAATIVISPTVAEMKRGAEGLADGTVMDRMVLLANIPTLADPSLTSDGSHVLSLEALFTPYAIPGGWERSTLPESWLDQFSTFMQDGFRASVRSHRTMTPESYENLFHLPLGHATSFPGGPLSAFLGRDRELSRYETPVKGLYLCGAATFPGAGVWGASGRNAALTIIKRL